MLNNDFCRAITLPDWDGDLLDVIAHDLKIKTEDADGNPIYSDCESLFLEICDVMGVDYDDYNAQFDRPVDPTACAGCQYRTDTHNPCKCAV